MKFQNSTIQNKSKTNKLSNKHVIPHQNVKSKSVAFFLRTLLNLNADKQTIIYSIGCELVKNSKNPNLTKFLKEYKIKKIKIPNIPNKVFDLLGSVYQFLNTKIENLTKGSYYTGYEVSHDFVDDLDFSKNQTIFDPSCGSGNFLFSSGAEPEHIIGVDFDPIAIMIAKFNYFIKFPDAPYPKLFCKDYFEWFIKNKDKKFDYIIGNPPYGANLDKNLIKDSSISSGESFSYFVEYCYKMLKPNGIFRFLLPEAILNVKRHSDIRNFILKKTNLKRIKQYTKKFSDVMSNVYMIELGHGKSKNLIFENETTTVIPKKLYSNLQNQIFIHLNDDDIKILDKLENTKMFDLRNSVFGLGVVTGDNQKILLKKQKKNAEPIFTGKEITNKYTFNKPKYFIIYKRNELQQVAPDWIYRSPIKLVYKTINRKLKFVIDKTKSLTTNSANILIPKIEGIDIYAILALLNSKLYSFAHYKMFGGVNKVAKEHLQALPFPKLNQEQNSIMREMTIDAIKRNDDSFLQDYINKKIFRLSNDEIEYMEKIVDSIK